MPMLLLSAGTAVFLAACGGSSGSGDTGTSAGPGSSFVSRADFACRTRNDATVAASQIVLKTSAQAALFTREIASAYEKELTVLSALKPPASAKNAFAAFVADEESIANSAHQASAAADAGNVDGFNQAHHQALTTEVDSLPKAAAAGLTVCAQKLPASDQAAIKQLAITGTGHPTAAFCSEGITHHFLVTNFDGNQGKCREDLGQTKATTVQVTQLYGILPSATVYVTQQGPKPAELLLGVLKQKGTWRIDSAGPAP